MALPYDKQSWDTTSYVTPTRMNHIEQGIKDLSDNYNKVSQTVMGSSSEQYPVLISKSANASAETDTVRKASALTLQTNNGHLRISLPHSNTNEVVQPVSIGNDIPVGTEGNTTGSLRIFGKGNAYGQFRDSNGLLTANRTYELPNKSGVIALIDDIASTRYLKKSESSGNTFYLQGKVNTWFKVCFAYSEYNVLFSGALNYNQVKKIGGEDLTVSVDTSTGVVTFSGAEIRNNTNVLVEEIPI